MTQQRRVAFITGSARGLGRSMAGTLAREGHRVVISDIDSDAVERCLSEAQAEGLAFAAGKALDVSDEAAVNRVLGEVTDELGPVGILINNAGICKDTPALEVALELWRANLDIMLTGALLCTRAAAPGMIEAGWGRIINMGSIMSFTAFGRDVAYCTAKAGVLGLTRSLAAELGPSGITVNAICPGNINSRMMDEVARKAEIRDGLQPGEFLHKRAASIPRRRLGEADDVSALARFLCSDEADYIHGQSLQVNGGLMMT